MSEPTTIPPMTPAGIPVLPEDELLPLEGGEVLLRDGEVIDDGEVLLGDEELVDDEPNVSGPIQSCSPKIRKDDMV